jgi:heterodisulfide reductase subunit C
MLDTTFLEQVNQYSEQTLELCYHCHKCTSGCLVAEDMQYGPDQVLRMVQLGEKEAVLQSADIWICASCETCGTRCPNEIDIARVMDALRQMAYTGNIPVAEPDALKFHKLFLFLVKNIGRMHEASLMGVHKLWTMNLFSDLDSGAKLILKGKIPLIPHPIRNRQQIKNIYEAVSKSSSSTQPEEREQPGE